MATFQIQTLFDYTLDTTGSITVQRGASGSNMIVATRTPTSVSTQPVSFTLDGLPPGATASFPSNNPCAPTCSSRLEIRTASSTQAGTYAIKVTGSPLNKATTFNLVVINAPSGAEAFVARLYQEVLGRPPDPALQLWVNEIQRFGSVVPVVVAFFDSTEFLNRHLSNQEFVRVLYRTFFDREPDAGGRDAYLSELQGGCRTRDNLIDIFIRSPEFANLASFLPPLDAVTAFVTNAYVGILGRGPDLAGLTLWVNQLNQTRSVLALVNAFLGSSEFLALNTTNAQFVTVLYGALLGRVPDCPGLASWVAALNAGTLTRSRLVAQFAASPEFALIQMKLFPPDA